MKVVAYIDGFNIYHAIKKFSDEELKWVNYYSLCKSFCTSRDDLVAVNYFSAYAHWLGDDVYVRHNALVRALSHFGVNCVMSGFKDKPAKCPKCKHKWMKHEEKETDVRMSLEIISDAYENKFDCAMMITADTDFIPVMERLKNHIKKDIFLLLPPDNTRIMGMKNFANRWEVITKARIKQNLLPEKVITNSGGVITRPSNYSPVVGH